MVNIAVFSLSERLILHSTCWNKLQCFGICRNTRTGGLCGHLHHHPSAHRGQKLNLFQEEPK